MEVYTLDALLRRESVFDKFESLIWSERFSSWGDFELKVLSTNDSRTTFKVGVQLAMNESYRVMTVETVEDTINDDGQRILTVKGRSLEALMADRVAMGTRSDLDWTLTDTPLNILNTIFSTVCIDGSLDPGDVIPFVQMGNIFPADTIAIPSDIITYSFKPKTVYAAIKDLCDMYNIGFRIVRDADTSNLYFSIYAGSDRTTSQTTLPSVVFSPNLDNLHNMTELDSIAGFKNVAYVFCPVGHTWVYPDGVDPESGFDRHVLLVQADDITDTDPAVATEKMTRKGKEELAKNRRYSAFDGEIRQDSQYIYDYDYRLGDLIELQNVDGVTNQMQVTEQIFVSDRDGERKYPTLSLNTFITPGSWLSWDYNKKWIDYDADTTTTWATLP